MRVRCDLGNHKRWPVIDYLVRAQGTRTRVGAGQGAMGAAAEGPGLVESSTCALESGGIQRVRFRMQEWGGAVLGERPPLDEGQEQVPARGGGRRVGVKLGTVLPQGLGTVLKAQGSLAGELPLVMKIGQCGGVQGKIHG